MNRSWVIGLGLLLGLAKGTANAQDALLAELYGQGVHAYFSRDPRTAHELLTSAIEQGSRDPRSYYYRGLSYLALGRPDEAEADFKAGAALEAGTTDRIYPIAESLQRVQGRQRMHLEKYRQVARLTALSKATQIQKARYEQLQRSEKDVVRDPNRAAATPIPANGALPAADGSDPFVAGTEVKPEKAPEKPAEPAVTAATPAEADPFGAAAEAAKPSAEMPLPAADATTNPFADDKPAADTKPATPATPPAAGDDPFK